jgi:hypothetical protein
MIVSATDSTLPLPIAQNAAKAPAYPSVKAGKGASVGVFEIFEPACDGPVHIFDNGLKTMAVAPPGLHAYGILDLRKTLLAWPHGVPGEAIPQKIKSSPRLRQVNGFGVVRMQEQAPFLNQLADRGQRRLCFFRAFAEEHKIICISDHLVSGLGRFTIDRVEEQVGKQRADYDPLRGAALRGPSIHSVKDVCLEKDFRQFEHSPVGKMLADLLHKQVVRDAVKQNHDIPKPY